jgi:hypothetical protein
MHMDGVREKVSDAMKGRPMPLRGGNGQTTVPQEQLAAALGLTLEHAIPTAPIRGLIERMPSSYKVDLACVPAKLAVEVDGNSHKTLLGKARDQKKDAALRALGWSVLHFTNEQVLTNFSEVVETIRSSMILK